MLNPFGKGIGILRDVVHVIGLKAKRSSLATQGLNPAPHFFAIQIADSARRNQLAARATIFCENIHKTLVAITVPVQRSAQHRIHSALAAAR